MLATNHYNCGLTSNNFSQNSFTVNVKSIFLNNNNPRWEIDVLDSKAITKIQSVIIITIIVVAAVGGSTAYVLLSGDDPSSEIIKIGVLADLDGPHGKSIWQGVVFAAEQINAEGGLLGIEIEVIGEDTDFESGADIVKISSALTRLLTYHNVDFVIAHLSAEAGLMAQDLIADHKKIMILIGGISDTFSQRVLDNYEQYKYFFSVTLNATSIFQGMTESLLLLRENTGFNKIGILAEDLGWTKGIMEGLDYVLPEVHGFDLAYKGAFPIGAVDFSSYFAAAEVAGVEVLFPLIRGDSGIPFIKEHFDRQSPMIVYGGVLFSVSVPESWAWTDGKCDHLITVAYPIVAGFALTSKTLSVIDEYSERWDENPSNMGGWAYDSLRYILADAIVRAESINTEFVIEALEKTSIEITSAKNFVFTSSHGVMMGENPNNPEKDYVLALLFQWQNGKMVPVYPKKIMEAAGATYTYPDWPGPWDNLN